MKRLLLMTILFAPGDAAPASSAPEDIEALFEEQFAAAWREGDAERLAALWVEDGDWSSIVGSRRVVRGRESLTGVWVVGLRGRDTPASRAIRVDADHVRKLGDSHALVDVLMEFEPDTEGAIREAFVFAVRKEGDTWRIVSARAARVPKSDR